MDFLINIENMIIVILDVEMMKSIGIIDVDYGLIRYILEIFYKYIITIDKNGYLHIENRDIGQTLFHRIVLEYYAKYDDKIKEALNNRELEVNHKNKLVWDNRLENLEIVTKANNLKHRDNKKYDVYISTEYLISVQNRLKKQNKYKTDKLFMQKVNRNNSERFLKNDIKGELHKNMYLKVDKKYYNYCDYSGLDSSDFDYYKSDCYYSNRNSEFDYYCSNSNYKTDYYCSNSNYKTDYYCSNSITKSSYKYTHKYSYINILENIDNIYFTYNKNNIFYKYCNDIDVDINTFTQDLIYNFHKHIVYNIIKYNLYTLAKYKSKKQTDLLKRFNILDINYEYKDKKTNSIYNDQYIQYINHNILIDLYRMIVHGNIHFIIDRNQIILNVPIRVVFCTSRVTNSFTILYYLNYFTKLPHQTKINKKYLAKLSDYEKCRYIYNTQKTHKIHDCSHFILNKFTKELVKQANKKSEELLKHNITKCSHFIIKENINSITADELYKNPICNAHTKRAELTASDINDIISNVYEEIETFGFYTVEEIIEQLKQINLDRFNRHEQYNEIYKNCDRFVRSTLSSIPKTQELLKRLNLKYVTLNKQTIEKIKKHQTKNNAVLPDTKELHYNQKVIVLKKLYSKSKRAK